MWFVIGITAVFLGICIWGMCSAANDGEREGVWVCGFFSLLCVVFLIIMLRVNQFGNRELVTYTFSSKDYTFKREIVVSTTFEEVGDSLVAREDRDTLYILSGVECCVADPFDEGAAHKKVTSEILDLRNKEK